MRRAHKPPSQTWRTFIENHVGDIVAIDFFVVATVSFRLPYGFIVLRHDPQFRTPMSVRRTRFAGCPPAHAARPCAEGLPPQSARDSIDLPCRFKPPLAAQTTADGIFGMDR
jgi:hypothetical protein